ncbi:AAA family ATPase, partial [Streptomyces sp. NPDC015127]|uniref:AAA family ATPase n=1 Tax=Streptomyces sp. NPDC015127 TaxID=3364939 RepID=UPI0036FD6C0C
MPVTGLTSAGGRWPLVGRDQLLAEFRRLLADVRCSGFMVCGTAGVGKSRLAAECAEVAGAAGWQVGRAVATEAARNVPLGAIAHLLPAGVDFTDPGSGFAAVASRMKAAGGGRLVMLVDDVPLLDATSALLLRELIDTKTIFLIGTVRRGQKLSHAVQELTASEAVHREELGILTEKQVADLLQQVLGGSVGRWTVHEFFAGSGGNPLFLRELVLGALAAGDLESDGEVWDLARGELFGRSSVGTQHLSELITARLTAAEPEGKALLEALAVCGELSLNGAEAVAPLGVLDSLEDAGLVRRATDRRRTSVMLAQPLYSEILRARVPYLRRREILLRQADLVESHGSRRHGDALRTASWRLAGGGNADPELLIHAAALAKHAHDYGQVAYVLEALPDNAHTLATRLMLGEALREIGRSADAETVLLEAGANARDEEEQLAVTIARALNLFLVGARTDRALAVIDETREALSRPAAQHALHVTKGYILALSGRLTEALRHLEELEGDVSESAYPPVWLLGASVKGGALAMTGKLTTAKEIAERGYEAHLRTNRKNTALTRISLMVALSENGEIAEARRVGEQAFSDLVANRVSLPRVWIAYHMGRVEWLAGDAAAARRWYAESVALARSQN